MPQHSDWSKQELATCHPLLREVFTETIKIFDHRIICGHRTKAEQNRLVTIGKSQLCFPKSKHNRLPSEAADAAPYPIEWEELSRFIYFAGIVKGIAHERGILIRWGGDWNGDTQLKDNKFNDYCHYELLKLERV